MQGVIGFLIHEPVGRHGHRNRRALHGDADIIEPLLLQQRHMAQCTFHQCLRRGMPILCKDLLFQRAAIDANADGNMLFLAHVHHGLDPFFPTDIAGIDADFRSSPLCRGNGQPVVKVNIRHQRQRRFCCDIPEAFCGLHIRHGQPGNLTPGGLQGPDLRKTARYICCFCVEHGLNADRRIAAHQHRAHLNLTFHSYPPATSFTMSLNVTNTISPISRIRPAAWI